MFTDISMARQHQNTFRALKQQQFPKSFGTLAIYVFRSLS